MRYSRYYLYARCLVCLTKTPVLPIILQFFVMFCLIFVSFAELLLIILWHDIPLVSLFYGFTQLLGLHWNSSVFAVLADRITDFVFYFVKSYLATEWVLARERSGKYLGVYSTSRAEYSANNYTADDNSNVLGLFAKRGSNIIWLH